MDFDKDSLEQIYSWFKPTLAHPSFCNITWNLDDLPNKNQLAPSLRKFNLYRMSGLFATSKSPFLNEDMMILIKSFLHQEEVNYDSIKTLWYDDYVKQLKKYKDEDDFDVMYYDIGTNDYLWAFYRLRKIRELFNLLENENKEY